MIVGFIEKTIEAFAWSWNYPVGKFGLIAFGIIFICGLIADINEWFNKQKIKDC